jgi:putative DNA methylase
LEYRAAPCEVAFGETRHATPVSAPFTGVTATQFPVDGRFAQRGVYLACGSSDATGLPAASVDFVVTDPPFFDNVHYSELADFFYAWQMLHPRGFIASSATTRHAREVQDTDADAFATKLRAVFAECHRVLKDEGRLVFSYHHSRADGWSSLAKAIFGAGFSVVEGHPVRAEMSVAAPKAQASEPIQLDVLLVCRKSRCDPRPVLQIQPAWEKAERIAGERCARLSAAGFRLSRHDRRVVRGAQFLTALGPLTDACAMDWRTALAPIETEPEQPSESALREPASALKPRPTGQIELFA